MMFDILVAGSAPVLEEDLYEAVVWMDNVEDDDYDLPQLGEDTEEGGKLYIVYKLAKLYEMILDIGVISSRDFKVNFYSAIRKVLISKMENGSFVVDKGFIRFMSAYIRVRRYDEVETVGTEDTFLNRLFSTIEEYKSLKESLGRADIVVSLEDFDELVGIVGPNENFLMGKPAKPVKMPAKRGKKPKFVDEDEDFDDDE